MTDLVQEVKGGACGGAPLVSCLGNQVVGKTLTREETQDEKQFEVGR